MNSNSVIANSYGRLLDDIKKLSTKSQLLLEKGAAYQLNLSLVELTLSFPGMEKNPDKLNLLSYQQNLHLFSWKYKFYDIADNQIKNCKIFLPYTKFKNKDFEFDNTKKTKK